MSKEFFIFCTIGALNTAVDFAIFFLAIKVIGADKLSANILAWFVAVQLSYFLNSRFTFNSAIQTPNLKDLSKFMLSGIVGLLVATASLLMLSQLTGLFVAKIISIFIGLVFNFTLAKHFVFNKKA